MNKRSSNPGKPQTIDEYLRPLDPGKRAALQGLREAIHAAVPDAEECISYGVPAFRLDGRFLVAFGAASGHCAFYPGASLQGFEDELAGFETGKGTVRFQPDHPLPRSLVRKLVRAQMSRKHGTVRTRKKA